MLKNKILLFFGIFLVAFTVIYSVSLYQESVERNKQDREITLLLSDFESKFEDFIELLLSQGIVTSEYFRTGMTKDGQYESLVAPTVQGIEEIYGVNLLDKQGKIIQVYPYEANKASLNKVTQHIESLKLSVRKNEEFWLSPPFQLYQGPQGFVLYIPIKQDNQLQGWIAPVIALDTFCKNFLKSHYFDSYHLVIKDTETNRTYFETEKLPSNLNNILIHHIVVRGRDISFSSWPRKSLTNLKHLPLSISLALLISFISSYVFIFLEQKVKLNLEAQEVDYLLGQSITDASHSLTVLINQMELLKMGMGHVSIERLLQHTNYLSTTMEQIKTLQKMSSKEDSLHMELLPLSEVLPEMVNHFSESLKDRQLSLHVHYQDFLQVKIMVNKSLFIHSVLYPLIENGLNNAVAGSSMDLSCLREKDSYHVSLKIQANDEFPLNGKAISGMKKVMSLMKGDVLIETDLDLVTHYIVVIPLVS